jgi:hypothetical protein
MSIFMDIATDAMTAIGQLGVGQTISPEQATQAQRVANRMLSKWSLKRLYLYDTPRITLALTAGQQSYTLGPTGVFAQTRPTFIQAAQVALPGSQGTSPLSILDAGAWGGIRDKGALCSANGLPQDLWPEYSYPNITLWFWTIPNNAAQLFLEVWQQLQTFATLYDTLSFPPGYEEAIMWNLAMELCSFFDMPISPSVGMLAQDGLATIQAFNAQGLGLAAGESVKLDPPNKGIPIPTAPAGGQ